MSGSMFQPSGDANWDRGLGTLAGALFPNPLGIAQAGYYGAEQRKAQVQALQGIEQINAGHQANQLLPGQAPGQPNRIQYTTQYSGGAANMPPVIASPSGLPMQGQPQPSLGQTVAGGGQAPAAPPGGAPPPPAQVSPETLGNILAPGNEPHPKGFGATGTPPPASSPVPGAPPAPNTTASDGSVPNNDQGSGPLHYGGVTSPDGGQKYAPPAAANGSPAPPNFDLGTYTALQAAAGRNPEMAKVQILGYILDAEQRGVLPVGTAKSMQANADRLTASFGSPVYGANVQRDTSLGVAGIQAGSAANVAGIQGQTQRDVAATQAGSAANVAGIQGATQRDVAATQAGSAANVAGIQGATQRDVTTTTQTAETERTRLTNQGAMDRLDKQMVEVINPDGSIGAASYQQAREQHLRMTPKSVDAMHALAMALAAGGNLQPSREIGASQAAMQPAQPMTGQEQLAAENHLNTRVTQLFAPTEGFQRDLGIQLHPSEQADVLTRAQEIYNQRGPAGAAPSAAYHNYTVSVDQAIKELQQTGHMPTQVDMQGMFDAGRYLGHDERVKQQVNPGGKIQSRYIVPQLKPYQPGAIGVAPPGMKDEDPVRAGNLLGVVRDGFIYPR